MHILLLQLPVPASPALNTPLAAGYLKAYAAAQGLLDQVDITILPSAIADGAGDAALIAAIVERQPTMLGLSLYTWNSERSLHIALQVKARLPNVLVVGGGPELQHDNRWVLMHPGLDIGVIGEGEQTFAELLRLLLINPRPAAEVLASIPGVVTRDGLGQLHSGPDRVPLDDLAVIPSPYLAGYLEVAPTGMLMVEVSRWCPYTCSFCLYGRNRGPRLGNRYFSLERVLAELAWGKARGIQRVHLVEANLNLVPLFWSLLCALVTLNADRQLTIYAELRGEHLTDNVVAALDRANVRYVEVGLQTANPTALQASRRRTDLAAWAEGTRRLYAHQIEVYLDVILGLPADDEAGIQTTLDFLEREALGPYDLFILQVLPGTPLRQQANTYALRYQDRPPYYTLGHDRLAYADLYRLRRQLKAGAGFDPDEVEGMPEPRPDALNETGQPCATLIQRIVVNAREPLPAITQLALHVDILLYDLSLLTPWLTAALRHNPTTIFDIYLLVGRDPPAPATLVAWRDALPYTPTYLDRVAVYSASNPDPPHCRVSPRLFLVAPWASPFDPDVYQGIATLRWQ